MDTTENIPISEIGIEFESLRIARPEAEAAIMRSMQRYGQLSPVIVGKGRHGQYQLVDGFKRFRSGGQLGYQTIAAKIMPGNDQAQKAAMINLNMNARAIADIEIGLIIRSLHRQDHLKQTEIALLLGRHKSFVCRRLALVERLSDEVISHLSLGLINMTTGRELALLPCGNQADALETVLKYRLDTAQTAKLVHLLLGASARQRSEILRYPKQVLDPKELPAAGKHRENTPLQLLLGIEAMFNRLPGQLDSDDQLQKVVERIRAVVDQLWQRLTATPVR